MSRVERGEKDDLIFRALADRRRRKILDLLKNDRKSTGEICERFHELDRCTVMQHLGVLEKADLIIVKREGRLRWNYLNSLPIKEIYDRWISEYASFSLEMLAKLKQDMEK